MSKKKEAGSPTEAEKGHSKSRRKVVNSLMFGGVAAGAVTTEKWTRPVVDAVLLPAHAQTSACVVEGFTVVVTQDIDGGEDSGEDTTQQTFNSNGAFDPIQSDSDEGGTLNFDVTVQAPGAPDGQVFDLELSNDLDLNSLSSSADFNAVASGGQVNWDIERGGYDDSGTASLVVNPAPGCEPTGAIEIDFAEPDVEV